MENELYFENSSLNLRGEIEGVLEYPDGKLETICFSNTVLLKGREALAACLANKIDDSFDFFIARMLFGDGGTNSGVPKAINAHRNGLFGVTLSSRPVTTTIHPTLKNMITVTSYLRKEDAADETITEMALQLNNGDLYSMSTFKGITKPSTAGMYWYWRLFL